VSLALRHCLLRAGASLPGLTRQSIFTPRRWTRGSSPRVTRKERMNLIGTRAVLATLVLVGALAAFPLCAGATKIERIVSPGGLTAWLVREPSVPLIAFDFAFKGGATQDPPEKPGVATMAAALLDEGAGDIDSKSFHERLEAMAIEIGFTATRRLCVRIAAYADREPG